MKLVSLFFQGLMLFSCLTISNPGFAKNKVIVFVSIPPQKYFVEKVGGDLVDVSIMVQAGASPHIYEPKPRQMAALTKTDLYFAIGVEFEERWLPKISATNPNMKVIHTDEGIKKITMMEHAHDEDEHHDEHDHEKEKHHDEHAHEEEDHHDEHDHYGLDPHIWLSPALVKIQAETIRETLSSIDPANRSKYSANFKRFASDINELDTYLKRSFKVMKSKEFMVFHPSWGYLADAYNLKQVPIEVEGKDPKPAQLKELIEHAREENIKVIFVQPQFSARNAKLIAREIGGKVVFVDPLEENWDQNLRAVADQISKAR